MKERFYYLKKETGGGFHKCGIVYLIQSGNEFARGISLCNDSDRFKKESKFKILDGPGGLERARGRALKALNKKKNSQPIKRNEAKDKLIENNCLYIDFKSEYDPEFNDFENEILADKK